MKAETINKFCAAAIECQNLCRKYDTAQPLAITESAILWHANAVQSYAKNCTRYELTEDLSRIKEIARGILPSLRYIADRDAVRKRDLSESNFLTFAEKPDDRDTVGNAEPFGVDGYHCQVCSVELSNAYFHCDGCEYSGNDFNLCTDCYVAKKYIGRPHYDRCTCGPRARVSCTCRELRCNIKGCAEGRKPCSCTCHERFHRRTRFYTDDEIQKLVSAAESMAGAEVKYHEETTMRLRNRPMVRPGGVDEYMVKMKALMVKERELAAKAAQMKVEQSTNDAQENKKHLPLQEPQNVEEPVQGGHQEMERSGDGSDVPGNGQSSSAAVTDSKPGDPTKDIGNTVNTETNAPVSDDEAMTDDSDEDDGKTILI